MYTASDLAAWAPQRPDPNLAPIPTTPLNPDQEWFTKESYLLWLPHEDDLDYANKVSEKPGSPFRIDVKLEKPHFEWNSGVRVGLGKYLPNHNLWDVSIDATYLYAEADSHSSPRRDQGSFLTAKWAPLFEFVVSSIQFNGGNHGSVHWRLNFFYEDLSIGRLCTVTPKITARPFIGLRGAQFYEKQTSKLSDSNSLTSSGIIISRNMNLKGNSEYWGIGGRAGTDFTFKFNEHWSLLGNLSGSILFGHQDVRESISMQLVESDPSIPATFDFTFNFKGRDGGYGIRANFEGALGLGWETWVRNHTVRLAPSLMFEASEWLDMNQWLDFRIPSDINAITPEEVIIADRRYGNLGFIGLTFNFHVDF
jgi:hypothetical protein